MSLLSSDQKLQEVTRVLNLESQALLDALQRLSEKPHQEQWIKALEILEKSLNSGGKIIVTGVGKSGKIAQKIAATLSSTGSLAYYLHPTEGLHGDLGILQGRDTVLALSYSGNTEELLRLIPSIKALGAPIVAIAGNPHSKIVEQCQAYIDASISQEACPHNLAPTTSTTLALAIGDALAVTLMQIRGFNAKQFAELHPAGSIGKKLQLKVSDLMHKVSPDLVLSETATTKEVVLKLTQNALGAVLIVKNEKLIGLITDGDLRRALKHQEKLFEMKAFEIMTAHPITITPETMAWDALQLMENRPHQIKELLVVDFEMKSLGLFRIHDIAKAL
jgi:arabinose-5-phosphate isomerase